MGSLADQASTMQILTLSSIKVHPQTRAKKPIDDAGQPSLKDRPDTPGSSRKPLPIVSLTINPSTRHRHVLDHGSSTRCQTQIVDTLQTKSSFRISTIARSIRITVTYRQRKDSAETAALLTPGSWSAASRARSAGSVFRLPATANRTRTFWSRVSRAKSAGSVFQFDATARLTSAFRSPASSDRSRGKVICIDATNILAKTFRSLASSVRFSAVSLPLRTVRSLTWAS